jgi:uncharacterized Zn-binding protein involved in type VI secretion
MPGPLLHVGALLNCTHMAPIVSPTTNTRVFVGGRPALTMSDVITVTACPFQVPGPKPQPCVIVRATPSVKVLINGQPAALLTPTTLCFSAEQVPQGPPNSSATQPRAIAM